MIRRTFRENYEVRDIIFKFLRNATKKSIEISNDGITVFKYDYSLIDGILKRSSVSNGYFNKENVDEMLQEININDFNEIAFKAYYGLAVAVTNNNYKLNIAYSEIYLLETNDPDIFAI